MADKTNNEINNYKVLGILIRSERINKNLSLRDLGQLTNISHTLISNIEKGKQVPASSTLADIFKVLELQFYDNESLIEEFQSQEEEIYQVIFNQEYETAHYMFKKLEEKENQFQYSPEVVNYTILKCFLHAITNNQCDCLDETFEHYDKVIEFFSEEQKQIYFFSKGLHHLNQEHYNKATEWFNKALKLGDKDIDVFIKEYSVISYVRQYKFMDAYRFSQEVIKEMENRTIYIRAMKTKLQVARILYHIAKNDETLEIVEYVLRFANKFEIMELQEECIMLKTAIQIRKQNFEEAGRLLDSMPDNTSISTVLLRYKIAFVQEDNEKVWKYFKEISEFESITSHEKIWTYIKMQTMSRINEYYNKEEYLKLITRLTEISSQNNDQEMIGIAHNYLIMYHHEERSYKKALEIAEKLLRLKKIRIDDHKLDEN